KANRVLTDQVVAKVHINVRSRFPSRKISAIYFAQRQRDNLVGDFFCRLNHSVKRGGGFGWCSDSHALALLFIGTAPDGQGNELETTLGVLHVTTRVSFHQTESIL